MPPVVVHDLVVQVLLVGQVPVRGQVLLVCLLVEVTQLGCRGDRRRAGLGAPCAAWLRQSPAAPLPLHCSRWETSSAALLSLQGSLASARSFLICRVKRYLQGGQELP